MKIPNCLDRTSFPYFVRGLFEGDGHFHILQTGLKDGLLTGGFSSANKTFLVNLQSKLKKYASIVGGSIYTNKAGVSCLKFGHHDSILLGKYMYEDHPEGGILTRKYDLWKISCQRKPKIKLKRWAA